MTEKIVRCDSCGKIPAMEVRYNFTRQIDSDGNIVTECVTIDLCHEHAIKQLQASLECPYDELASVRFMRWARLQKSTPQKPRELKS